MSTNSAQYTTVAKILHWLIGLGVLAQIGIGWWMINLPKGAGTVRVDAFNMHKSIGVLVMPVTGVLGSMFTKFPIKYFGYTIYRSSSEWPAAQLLMSQIHYGCVILFMPLIALHIAASLKHEFAPRDGVFQRMWLGGDRAR